MTQKNSQGQRRNSKLALRLWFSGYGIIEGIGYEPITDDLLKEVADKFSGVNNGRRKRIFTLLSYLLSKEKRSLVQKLWFFGKEECFRVRIGTLVG